MSKSVTLAYPYTDAAGKKHSPDTTLDLPDGEANRLLHGGRARAADAPRRAAKQGAAKKAAGKTTPTPPADSKEK